MEAAAELGIEVFHLRGKTEFLRSIPSTAEHTWALLLSLARKIPAAYASVKYGEWEQEPYRGHELHEKRLGILGCGRLGGTVAHYARAFGMKVSTFDPHAEFVPSYVARTETLSDLLAGSDILSIHVPLNEETRGMIGQEELAHLPNGAVLINTSRGEIVDESALVSALRSGRLAGAAVDVVQHELDPERRGTALIDYARDHDNLIITPHIGGATVEAVAKTDLFLIGQLVEWLELEQNQVAKKG
jgi:D-3-phosphoglycerate dehydrogenase